VLYINRYDWSYHWHDPTDSEFELKFQAFAEPVIGPIAPEENWVPENNFNLMGHFMALDADGWSPSLLRAYKEECEGDPHPCSERIFMKDGTGLGTYVRLPRTEYEFGKSHLHAVLDCPGC